MRSYKYRIVNLRYYIKYKLGLKPAFTQTSAAEQQCLVKHVLGKTKIAEIGVFQGVNTRSFREHMAEDGVILAIDPYIRSAFGLLGFGWIRRIAHQEVSSVKRGKVIWIETLGRLASTFPEIQQHLPLDFLFIDGDHSWDGISGDWQAWSEKVMPGGIVALHDSINTNGCGSEKFTQQVIMRDQLFTLIEIVDTLTILERKLSDLH